ncbi:SMC-Scp complex subunit ScpB, partial [Staphylococcus xylosus]|nr:SMC-Scp complex subunit ScpB [Staphylococcus xylosus]
PKGRKEVPGRPVLWGTTPQFLKLFGLASLADLPRREELLFEPSSDGAGTGLEDTIQPS